MKTNVNTDKQKLTDAHWMKRALVLARKPFGQTHPNPMVGAIVLDAKGKFVSSGFHEKQGLPHAERIALNLAKERAKNGTLYVTLEPCCHDGKTPPCTDIILEKKIKRVVVATLDPFFKVSGKGIEILRSAGIEVVLGIEEKKAQSLNHSFFKFIVSQKPFVTGKVALSQENIMGTRNERLKISNAPCDALTHKLRAECDGILIGIETLLSDNPQLTVRGKYAFRKPTLLILDPSLKTPPNAKIFDANAPVWIFCRESNKQTNAARLLENKAHLFFLKDLNGIFQFKDIFNICADQNLVSILIEGGKITLEEALRQNALDRLIVYQSSKKNLISLDAPSKKNWVRFEGLPMTSPTAHLKKGEDRALIWDF